MTERTADQTIADASAWWDTSIIDIHPGQIDIRGYPVEQLIGRVRFPEMIWLMLRGELPAPDQAELLEAALVPGVDHGPHAPSIAIFPGWMSMIDVSHHADASARISSAVFVAMASRGGGTLTS